MAEQIPMTADGYRRLEETLNRERGRRDEAVAQIAAVRDDTNGIEDRNLEVSQIDLQSTEARVLELEDVLARAVIVEGHEALGLVELGSVVVLRDETHDREMRVRLVSAVEVSALTDGETQVSDDSPVGQALQGRQQGDMVEVEVGERTARYRIEAVEPS
ncbi:transcription elongation factor GreA [Deinococcus metalli]|uniref:Transcription elongation factor GreA n=1 Tax=Deinococcus metalli TaxID=1141878 RepID=A0A7W8KKF3_9DEIO|nr:GreA/GreB family elongation factor [Deinococcus metalli]MBB5378179.1 transcription elongation factor GreA [Deinococcus metalli]GHF56626.1 transcription elongation factor GreA [Deinococcus metalli]